MNRRGKIDHRDRSSRPVAILRISEFFPELRAVIQDLTDRVSWHFFQLNDGDSTTGIFKSGKNNT